MTPDELHDNIRQHSKNSPWFFGSDRYVAWRNVLNQFKPARPGHGWAISSACDARECAEAHNNADQIWAAYLLLYGDADAHSHNKDTP